MSAPAVVTVWAESAQGPGLCNYPVWVLLRETAAGPDFGKLRIDCIQPEDQTPAMVALYSVSEAVHEAMSAAVQAERNRAART